MNEGKEIRGTVAISRDLAVGGRAYVRSSAHIGHNLRVDGWLDAPNMKGVCKGLFKTEVDLNKEYPEPEGGWFALVGDTLPATVYTVENGEWKSTGKEGGDFALYPEYLDRLLENEIAERKEKDELLEDADTELLNRLQGKSEKSSAKTDPFVYLGLFNSLTELMNRIDNLELSEKYNGTLRASLNGIMVYVHNYVVSYQTSTVVQHIFGPVDLKDGVLSQSNSYAEFWRNRIGNNPWKEWTPVDHITRNLLKEETEKRIAADNALATGIEKEKEGRTDADTELGKLLEKETENRKTADNNILGRITGTSQDSRAYTDPFMSQTFASWEEVRTFVDDTVPSKLSTYSGTVRMIVNGTWLLTLRTAIRINGSTSKRYRQHLAGFVNIDPFTEAYSTGSDFRQYARLINVGPDGIQSGGAWEEIIDRLPKNWGKSCNFFGGSQTEHAFRENSTSYKFGGRFPLAKALSRTTGQDIAARCSAKEGAGFCTPAYPGIGATIPITRQVEVCTPCDMYVFWLGTNDYSKGVNFGNPNDAAATSAQVADGSASVVSAFKYCVKTLTQRNKSAGLSAPKFFLITPLRTNYGPESDPGNRNLGMNPLSTDERSMAVYTDILKKTAILLSIPVLDLWTNSNLEQNRGESFTVGSDGLGVASGYFFDGTHLSVEGYAELAQPIADFIAHEYHYVSGIEPKRHVSARDDGYIFLGDFNDTAEEPGKGLSDFNAALNGMAGEGVDTITAMKFCGRVRARINGVNVEIYQFATSYTSKHFTQLLFGNVRVSAEDAGKVVMAGAGVFSMLTRACINGIWGEWGKYGETSTGSGNGVGGTPALTPGRGISIDESEISVNAGEGLAFDSSERITISKNYLKILQQMAFENRNGAGLAYNEAGKLTLDLGDGLELNSEGQVVATGGSAELDPAYKEYLDKKLAEEFDSKFSVNLSANKSVIEKGANTSVTLTGTATNSTGKAIERLELLIGTSAVKTGTSSPQSYSHTANDSFTAKATLKLVGYATVKEKSVSVSAYYPIYTGVSTKTEIAASDFGTALTKYGTISNTAVRKEPYDYTIPSGGGYPYLAVPSGVTAPTKILVLGAEAGMVKQGTVTVNGVAYQVFRPTEMQAAGAVSVQYA